MKIKYLAAVLGPVLFTAGVLHAGVPAPTQFNAYDGVAPGARAIAMGGAFCAICDDASAAYYNPAGLCNVKQSLVSITYEMSRQSDLTSDQIFAGEALRNRSFQYLSFVTQKGAFSWRPLANYTTRTENGQDFENDEVKINAYTVSAGHSDVSTNLSTGINLTYLSGIIAQSKLTNGVPYISNSAGYGVSMDFGFLYTASPELKLGVTFKNLAGYMWWDDFEKDQLPFILKTGLDYHIKDFTNLSAEVEKRYYRKVDEQDITSFGIEQWLGTILSLRAGMSGTDLNDKEQTTFSGGIGYTQTGFALSLTGKKYRLNLTDVFLIVMSVDVPI